MKTINFTRTIFPVLLLVSLAACKKEEVDSTEEYKTQTDDQLQISAEIDLVTIDANSIVESSDYFFARSTNAGVCDATYTIDSTAAFKFITINYDGVTCSRKTKRTGQVIISIERGTKWSDAGAVLHINYQHLRITRLGDDKSIILNGQLDLTNETGGRMSEIMSKSLVHLIHSSNMSIQFEDGSKRSWNLAVRRVYSFDNGLVITSTGNHTEGDMTGISAWGVTRRGRQFTTTIVEPMIIRQDCNFRMVSAKLIQQQAETLTIQFGLNAQGEKVTCPAGNYFLQVSWKKASKRNFSLMLPY